MDNTDRINQTKQYCTLENNKCKQHYNHWCYGELCEEAKRIESKYEENRRKRTEQLSIKQD